MKFGNNFTIDEVRNFWDGVADIYEKENEKISETHHQRFIESLKYLEIKDNHKILNIWSRTGAAIPYLRNKNKNTTIHNLEASGKMIEKAEKKFPNENFLLTDLSKLNFPDNYFDYILSLETFEHCPTPLNFLKELYRVLRPGGKLIMSTPPASCEPAYAIYNFFGFGHGEGPHKFLSSKKVKEMLNLAGFVLLNHKGTLLLPLGPKFLKKLGEKIINHCQNTFIKELGIRQFYICQK